MQSPCPCGRPWLTRTSAGDTQTLKSRSGSVPVGSPGAHKVFFEPSKHHWRGWGLSINMILPPVLSWGFSFAHGSGIIFLVGSNILLLMVVQQPSCNFGVLTGEDEYTSFYSTILDLSTHQNKTRFSPSQSLPSGRLYKPLILIHQRADRMKTTIREN